VNVGYLVGVGCEREPVWAALEDEQNHVHEAAVAPQGGVHLLLVHVEASLLFAVAYEDVEVLDDLGAEREAVLEEVAVLTRDALAVGQVEQPEQLHDRPPRPVQEHRDESPEVHLLYHHISHTQTYYLVENHVRNFFDVFEVGEVLHLPLKGVGSD